MFSSWYFLTWSFCGASAFSLLFSSAACPLGHPKWEQPAEDEEGNKTFGMGGLAAIRCHACNEFGHKASQCTNKRAEVAQNVAGGVAPANTVSVVFFVVCMFSMPYSLYAYSCLCTNKRTRAALRESF